MLNTDSIHLDCTKLAKQVYFSDSVAFGNACCSLSTSTWSLSSADIQKYSTLGQTLLVSPLTTFLQLVSSGTSRLIFSSLGALDMNLNTDSSSHGHHE